MSDETTKSFHNLLKFNDISKIQFSCPVAGIVYDRLQIKGRSFYDFLAQNPSNKMKKQKRVGLKVS